MNWEVDLIVELESGREALRSFNVKASCVNDAIGTAEAEARKDDQVRAVWVDSVK